MSKKKDTDDTGPRKIGRSAGTGKFTTVKEAQQKPKTHIVEIIKKPAKK